MTGKCANALWGWSPPDQPADTPLKRRFDRMLPRTGLAAVACFAAVLGLLSLAPHLPLRAGLAADGLAALAGGAWCGLNFWRCRHAHCAVTGAGWLALSLLAFTEADIGHSVIAGDEQPVFLAVLAAALIFEAAWSCVRGTNAVTLRAAPPLGRTLRRAGRPGLTAGRTGHPLAGRITCRRSERRGCARRPPGHPG